MGLFIDMALAEKTEPPDRIRTTIVASPENFEPTSEHTKVIGAFNPGVATIQNSNGQETVLGIRIAEVPTDLSEIDIYLPYWLVDNKPNSPRFIAFDSYPIEVLRDIRKKDVKLPDETTRLKHTSHLDFLVLNEKGEKLRDLSGELYPCYEHERFGIEDPRITTIGEQHFITTVSPHRTYEVSTSLLKTSDFQTFTRISPRDPPKPIMYGMKDVTLFPEKISGPDGSKYNKTKRFATLVRPNAFPNISRPGIWIYYSPDLTHWGDGERLTTSKGKEITGTGTPLLKLEQEGIWLAAIHEAVEGDEEIENERYSKYSTRLIGLDIDNPSKIKYMSAILLKRSDYHDLPQGYVPKVVYTTGMVKRNGSIQLFSGIDDTHTVMDEFHTEDLIKFLKRSSQNGV